MANYRANDVIRLTRKAVGLSQEAISEGICSVETFSRIERGKTKIKGDTYKKIMERLERNTDKFYAVCSGEDVDLLDDVAAIENAIAKFDYQLADSILGNVRERFCEEGFPAWAMRVVLDDNECRQKQAAASADICF